MIKRIKNAVTMAGIIAAFLAWAGAAGLLLEEIPRKVHNWDFIPASIYGIILTGLLAVWIYLTERKS